MLAGAIGGALLGLIVSQFVAARVADLQLEEYATGLLDRAVDVAQDSWSVLEAARVIDHPPCSAADLDELRHLAFLSEHIRDVGRVSQGQILCTALWGRIEAVPLPSLGGIQHHGTLLWANVPYVGGHRIKVDIASRGDVVVFTSPVAFRSYEARNDGYHAVVLAGNGGHVYRSFGDVAGLSDVPRSHWYDLRSLRSLSECSDSMDLCVVSSLGNVDISILPLGMTVGAALLGALSGASLGLAAFLYRHGRRSLADQVRRAIGAGRLTLVYQPLVRMNDRRTIGFEALARLTDEHNEDVPPEVFIRIAEEGGFSGRVARAVISKALRELGPTLRGRPDLYCGINCSTADILDATLCDYLDQEVRLNGLQPQQVVLEITERSTAHHETLLQGMEPFRQRGYEFYIDDFGTGYSNLSYLATLPIRGVKLDRMFTQAIGSEAVSSTIIENVCSIAGQLNLQLVIEGVEHKQQAEFIQRLYPDAIGQGWFYGRPRAIRDLGV